MSLKTCHRMLMAQHMSDAAYVQGQMLSEMGKSKKRKPRVVQSAAPETVTLSSSPAAPAPEPRRCVATKLGGRPFAAKSKKPRFLDPVPGVGQYDLGKYSDFNLQIHGGPGERASPVFIATPEMPTFNTAPVGTYNLPPPPQITKSWSFGKLGKAQSSPHAGRPIPAEIVFRSAAAIELAAVRHNPGPDVYSPTIGKDERMGVFTKDRRDKEKNFKEPAIGPGDYMKDNDFIKTERAALLDVVGRVTVPLPFRRKEELVCRCERLDKAESRRIPRKCYLTTSSWSTASKAGLFSQTDYGPGFTYGGDNTWFPAAQIKLVTSMRPPSVSGSERFAVHRMRHLSDRIWGPF